MKMITMTAVIARTVSAKTGRGYRAFNDKLADGRRSLKVRGWSYTEYEMAKRMLEDSGCEVVVRTFKTKCSYSHRRIMQTRLWVKESV